MQKSKQAREEPTALGVDPGQARRLKELKKENARLKRVVADLALEKQVLRDVAQGGLAGSRGLDEGSGHKHMYPVRQSG